MFIVGKYKEKEKNIKKNVLFYFIFIFGFRMKNM